MTLNERDEENFTLILFELKRYPRERLSMPRSRWHRLRTSLGVYSNIMFVRKCNLEKKKVRFSLYIPTFSPDAINWMMSCCFWLLVILAKTAPRLQIFVSMSMSCLKKYCQVSPVMTNLHLPNLTSTSLQLFISKINLVGWEILFSTEIPIARSFCDMIPHCFATEVAVWTLSPKERTCYSIVD